MICVMAGWGIDIVLIPVSFEKAVARIVEGMTLTARADPPDDQTITLGTTTFGIPLEYADGQPMSLMAIAAPCLSIG